MKAQVRHGGPELRAQRLGQRHNGMLAATVRPTTSGDASDGSRGDDGGWRASFHHARHERAQRVRDTEHIHVEGLT